MNYHEDVVLTGDAIRAFCDHLAGTAQTFTIDRLRTATRIERYPSLGQSEWRVTLAGNRGQVVVPVVLPTTTGDE